MFKAGDPAPDADELPFLLEDTFRNWLARNKELTVRTVLPIVSGGDTTAIHVWFGRCRRAGRNAGRRIATASSVTNQPLSGAAIRPVRKPNSKENSWAATSEVGP